MRASGGRSALWLALVLVLVLRAELAACFRPSPSLSLRLSPHASYSDDADGDGDYEVEEAEDDDNLVAQVKKYIPELNINSSINSFLDQSWGPRRPPSQDEEAKMRNLKEVLAAAKSLANRDSAATAPISVESSADLEQSQDYLKQSIVALQTALAASSLETPSAASPSREPATTNANTNANTYTNANTNANTNACAEAASSSSQDWAAAGGFSLVRGMASAKERLRRRTVACAWQARLAR